MGWSRCRAVLLALGLAWGSGCARPAPEDPRWVEPGVSDVLADLRAETISDLRYHYELRIPADREAPIDGRADISFRWSGEAGQPVILDFLEAGRRVRGVRVDGVEVQAQFIADHIRLPMDRFERGRTHRVEIEFSAGDGSLNRNEDYLYTLFVPDRARFALPLFDQPNLKGRFSLALDVPGDWEAVANGSEQSREDRDGRRSIRFNESAPISTYLFAFAAGRFEVETAVRAGREYRMFHRETDREKVERNAADVFDLHARALAWMEDYTGIAYPFEKYDFALLPAFQYGGMEHPGAVFYRSDGLLLEESPTQGQLLGRASLISHETAHMWFGDLVTMAWFEDVWLKEVFANFMAAKIVEPSFENVNHALRFALAHLPSAYAVDRTPGANPILQPLENLREAGTLYGAIIYQKAPVVMKHLERRMGEAEFRDGLATYLDRFRFGNARWADLIEIMDQRSDEDLKAWSRVWVEEPGRPHVRTTIQGNEILFEQFDPAGEGRLWPQFLDVWIRSEGGDEVRTVSLDTESARIALETIPRLAMPAATGTPYGLFELEPGPLDQLADELLDMEDPVRRGASWLTLWDATLEGWLPRERALQLLVSGVREERNELIFGRLSADLATAFWRFLPERERERWAGQVEDALWSRTTAQDTVTLRSSALRSYLGVVTTPRGVRRLRELWEGSRSVLGVPLSENDRTRMALELAVREVPGWEDILARQAERITNPDRKARFEFVDDALSADGEVRDAFFGSLADPTRREQEPWVLEALRYLNHPLRQERSVGYIRPSLDLLEEVQRTGDIFFPGAWVGAVLGGHNSQEAVTEVRAFLDAHPEYPDRLRNKIWQALDPLARAAHLAYPEVPRAPIAGDGA